jgi:Domain of unknown function (DUF5916)
MPLLRSREASLSAVIALALLGQAPTTVRAQDARRSVMAVATAQAPAIDGRLFDAPWQAAPAMTGFIQREPTDGAPGTERTEFRVLFDQDAIYVGVWAWDSHPAEIVPGDAIRDYEVTDADAVIMVFDTYRDEQNGFVFGTTPAGIEYDGQVASAGSGGGFFLGGGSNNSRRFQAGAGGGFNKNWDGSWEVATSQDGEGWYAEFRIPFSTLRYGSDVDSWGFNMSRRVRRLNEEVFWSSVPREFGLYRLDFAGDLAGLDPPFRRSVTATPYVLGSTERNYAAGDTEFDENAEVGGEAKIQVTQGLTLDLTVNTDFAQVEVDDAQVNLTRFPLLFPEKRPFFLENAGFFTVGGGGADLFFSRRIGIDAGSPVPIKGGGRFSGRTQGLNVGLLHIQTDGVLEGSGRNAYSVARVAKELPSRSRIGALFTDRRSDLDADENQTYAVDAQVGLGDQVTVTSWLSKTETPGLDAPDVAWDVTTALATRAWRANVTVQEIGEDFNPEIGFVPRRGHRYYQAFALWAYRPENVFRELRPHASYFTYRNRSSVAEPGFEISSRWHVDNHFEWPSGMELHTGANYVTEGLYRDFDIPGVGVTVPQGVYKGWAAAVVYFTDQSRALSFNSRFDWGAFLSGSKRTSGGDVTYRLGDRLSTTGALSYNDVRLPEGDFTTTLASLKLGWFFTPRIYLQGLVQYSDQVDQWSSNIRFGWLNTAGTGLFIVYNDVQGFDTLMGPQGRSVFIKYTRQFNLFGR